MRLKAQSRYFFVFDEKILPDPRNSAVRKLYFKENTLRPKVAVPKFPPQKVMFFLNGSLIVF